MPTIIVFYGLQVRGLNELAPLGLLRAFDADQMPASEKWVDNDVGLHIGRGRTLRWRLCGGSDRACLGIALPGRPRLGGDLEGGWRRRRGGLSSGSRTCGRSPCGAWLENAPAPKGRTAPQSWRPCPWIREGRSSVPAQAPGRRLFGLWSLPSTTTSGNVLQHPDSGLAGGMGRPWFRSSWSAFYPRPGENGDFGSVGTGECGSGTHPKRRPFRTAK